MNTKTFAQQARSLLMEGVAKKLIYWGFDTKGEVLEEPTAVSGGYTFRGDAYDDANVPNLWRSLKNAIAKKGIEVVVEEAAYTWFNRMMAMRILAKNGYDLPQLEYAEGLSNTPIILQKARQGQYAFLNATEKTRLQSIIGDYNKETEAFALLLVGYCHSHNTLNKVFGKLDDYTELLLPDNMLQDQGFLHLLNTTDAISDDEYKQVELIGWLYQFYISERKDEVFKAFKKKKKAEAKDIPAATQIFTPNWIVKYMVENTAGKLWLDHKPDSALRDKMKYLVDSSEGQGTRDKTNPSLSSNPSSLITNVEDLTLIDPACGSGHILVEGFDLLYQMYLEEYYTPEEAVQTIFEKNLYGLDIDDRAAQLASFAVLLKAAKVYPDVWIKNWQLNIYTMPEANSFSQQEVADFLGEEGKDHIEALDKALQLMQQAKNLGSVMQLDLSQEAIDFIQHRYQDLQQEQVLDLNLQAILQKAHSFIPVLLTLSRKFTAVVANPPYMGQKNMNAQLKNYVGKTYPLSKSDLFAVFMESTLAMTVKEGLMGMINQHSWMFLSSYEKLREYILTHCGIVNMLHLGPRTFEELSGEVVQSTAFVLENGKNITEGDYYRLVDYRNVQEKEENFLKDNNKYPNIPQTNFEKIPGSPIAYWVSENYIRKFEELDCVDKNIDVKQGLATGDNKTFLRSWFEISERKSKKGCSSISEAHDSKLKWFPYNKGGGYRKWYGNQYFVIAFDKSNYDILAKQGNNLPSRQYYFKEGITWSDVSSGTFACRYSPQGFVFDVKGSSGFCDSQLYYKIALLNTHFAANTLFVLNPTMSYQVGNIKTIPFKLDLDKEPSIAKNSKICISISKKDWDSRETSWDFKQSPLLLSDEGLEMRDENLSLSTRPSSLSEAYKRWEKDVTQDFFKLHQNEEELNRIFIDIYGLQDELTPEVALKDITILQEELDRKQLEQDEVALREQGLGLDAKDKGLPLVPDNYALPIDKAEVMQQFISYAIGLFMGRYRLDKPGLNIAHPNPTVEELASYEYNNGHVTIDSDAIIPLMGTAANFKDDALYQIQELLDTIWGKDTRTENLNFLQDGLNKDLEKYLVKDFWKYHCKTYKKKPIYWLFSSKKGAFQVLVYMHRMNAFTVEKIRANYLLEHLKYLNAEITALENNAANLNTQQARKLDQLRKDLVECEEYDMHLKNAADAQITFDLDDGVTENYKLFTDVVAKIK